MSTYYDTSYPPSLFVPPGPTDGRDAAKPGDSFSDPAITASDALNAAKLSGLGFVAVPQTAWLTGEGITVNTFAFHWNGSTWAAGVPALAGRASGAASVVPQEASGAPEGTVTAQEAPGGTEKASE